MLSWIWFAALNCGFSELLPIGDFGDRDDKAKNNDPKKYFTKEFKPYVIGYISRGKNKVKLDGSINWI